MVSDIISYGLCLWHALLSMIHSNPFRLFEPRGHSDHDLLLYADIFYHESKEGMTRSGTLRLRGAFSDTEDFLDPGLVSTSSTENIKPLFTKKLHFQTVLEGEPVELKCKVVACPPPTILWFHNNRSIPRESRRRIHTDSNTRMHTTSLLIEGVTEKDAGSYKVMAINTEGSVESTASLLVSLRDEQPANYLGFVRHSAKTHESTDKLAKQRKERKFRVDLRYVGSPFDKMSKVHQGRPRSKNTLVHAVYFRSGSGSCSKENVSEKECKRLETASERAPSPPPMFDRSECFNDRFSDIYCDRRTGARFSDKFSDRCSDRYSERFSDTESLHEEVRTKLNTLQKAVKHKKRLSISTMSSSEFELDSVTSESSYADYVDRLRVKPASLPDVQHFDRPLAESQGKAPSRESKQPRMRHSFEPQSRTRAIQIMRGELVDTMVLQTAESFSQALEDGQMGPGESQADDRFKRVLGEHHKAADSVVESRIVEADLYHLDVPYSEPRAHSDSEVPHTASPRSKSVEEKFPDESPVITGSELYPDQHAEESLGASYERSLDVEQLGCEENLLALRIRKWQQGSGMSEEETFHPDTNSTVPAQTQRKRSEGQLDVVEERTLDTEVRPFHFQKSPRMNSRMKDSEDAVFSVSQLSEIKGGGEKMESEEGGVQVESHKRQKRADARVQNSPRSRLCKEEFLREADEQSVVVESHEEEGEGCLRAQYGKSLEAERMECEEKLLNLRIRKWQKNIMSEEEMFHPETDMLVPAAEGPREVEQEAVDKQAAGNNGSRPKSAGIKCRLNEDETSLPRATKSCMGVRSEAAVMREQKSPRIKARRTEALPGTKARVEKMFEKTREENELHLSRENISGLKNKSEWLVSEEEALTQRIMEWQQGVLMEQGQSVKTESSWVEGHPPLPEEKTIEKVHRPQWQPAADPETRLQRDNEYFVNEEEALAQRIPKWQTDVVEQEDVAELEAGWALDTQYRQPVSGLQHESHVHQVENTQPLHGDISYEAYSSSVSASRMETTCMSVTGRKPSTAQLAFYGQDSHQVQSSLEGHKLASAQSDSPQKLPRELSPTRRLSRCSPHDVGRTREDYTMNAGKSSNLSKVRDEREAETSREISPWRNQDNLAGMKEESGEDFVLGSAGGEGEKGAQQELHFEMTKMKNKGCTGARGSHPVFVQHISSVKLRIGEMSELTCQFQGEPSPTATWLKDGHPLDHNPDYDIVSKSNLSKLIVFYPTTDHEGTYDCVITNKHGKAISSATLEILDKKVTGRDRKEVVIIEDRKRVEENLQSLEEEIMSYMKTGKATLQVPEAVIYRACCSDESLTSSPEIRVTAPTPVPVMLEEAGEAKSLSKVETISEVPSDDRVAQTVKHKFTFSFDVPVEAPRVISELENIICSQGKTAVLECGITGEPSPKVTWYCGNICLDTTAGKYTAESDGKVYRLYIHGFTHSDAGMYTCIAKNKQGEVTSICDASFEDAPLSSGLPSDVSVKGNKSRPCVPREPLTISGCGLQASAAAVKVSQIKQAFESGAAALITPPPREEHIRELDFPQEFIPDVASPLNQQKHPITLKPTKSMSASEQPCSPQRIRLTTKSASSKTSQVTSALEMSAQAEEKRGSAESDGEVKQFVEQVLMRPKPQMAAGFPEHILAGDLEMVREESVQTFERTSSFIPFHCVKGTAVKHSGTTSGPASEADKSKRFCESLTPEKPSEAVSFCSLREMEAMGAQVPHCPEEGSSELTTEEKREGKGSSENVFRPVSERIADEQMSFPVPSVDITVGGSLPFFQADLTEEEKLFAAADVVGPHTQRSKDDKKFDVREGEPKPLIIKPNFDSGIKPLGLFESATPQGSQVSTQRNVGLDRTPTVGFMEEEEVTFGAVYDYYNPPTDWGRPLSPESEMSIEIGSTVSEEVGEVTERFYTPGSSTGVSQKTAESFHTPKSPMSFQTPSSDLPGGFVTPQEYTFSPVDYKRPSTVDSSERFFSPVQFLPSPADEGIETAPPDINVDATQTLMNSRGLLGLAHVQEKVQGIPPAFLKPLVKKRVFENDTLVFNTEVFGLPSPDVKWFCNKTQLTEDHRVKMERYGDSISLTIHSVSKADQGEYICEAVNYVGEARSVALVLIISHELRFIPAPPAVTHQHVMEFDVEDDDSSRSPSPQEILLEVELDENEVKEFEKQVKIITIPEYTADNKSMIISLDVLPSIYEESAVDFVTREHDDLQIAFEVTEMPPRFINPICDMATPEGTTVMFECSLMGIPSPIVSWFKGDKKVPHDNKKYLHSFDGDNHFLRICRVTPQESGVYSCRAINVVGETLCRATLVVLSTKDFPGKTRGRELTAVSLGSAKVQPQKFDLMVGNTSLDGEQVSEIELEFEFQQEAEESQRAVRLVANTDSEINQQGEKYVSINFDVFAEPAKDDKIEFKGKSSDVCSFQFQVTEMPPRCVIPLTDVTAAVGTPAVLQCLVNGRPNPTAEWFKDGERVADSRCIVQEKTAGHFNLLITNVNQTDAGEYRCKIQNSGGCIETSALLKVI